MGGESGLVTEGNDDDVECVFLVAAVLFAGGGGGGAIDLIGGGGSGGGCALKVTVVMGFVTAELVLL